MRIIESYLPRFTVEFQHPDIGAEIHTFYIDDNKDVERLLNDSDHPGRFNAELKKAVWEKFNSSGYWHTMTLIGEHIFDGQVKRFVVCENAGIYDVM